MLGTKERQSSVCSCLISVSILIKGKLIMHVIYCFKVSTVKCSYVISNLNSISFSQIKSTYYLVPNMSWKQYSDYQSKMAMTNHVSKLIKHSYTQTSFLS
jgi:hypothetical protein